MLDIIRGILTDNNCFYLGMIIDGKNHRGIDPKGFIVSPFYTRHIVYLTDTDSLLTGRTRLKTRETLQTAFKSKLTKDWEVIPHEFGDVTGGILDGNMAYLDFMRLPIVQESDAEYLKTTYSILSQHLPSADLALARRVKTGFSTSWMPLDYRWAQTTAFIRTGKIEINYSNIWAYLASEKHDEVYENLGSERYYEYLRDELNKLESKARRAIL